MILWLPLCETCTIRRTLAAGATWLWYFSISFSHCYDSFLRRKYSHTKSKVSVKYTMVMHRLISDSCTSVTGNWLLTKIYPEDAEWCEACRSSSSAERIVTASSGNHIRQLPIARRTWPQASQNSSILVEILSRKHGKAKPTEPGCNVLNWIRRTECGLGFT